MQVAQLVSQALQVLEAVSAKVPVGQEVAQVLLLKNLGEAQEVQLEAEELVQVLQEELQAEQIFPFL